MSILDQPDLCTALDPKSMMSLLQSFPEQIQAAWKAGREISPAKPVGTRVLIVTGLGGSAIGGDLARSVSGAQLRVPLIVNRDYDLPGFADADSLVFACSYSGNTEETLSAYEQARRAKASIVCITSGGKLESMAKADGCPVISLPGGLPPRAALGYSLFGLLSAMQALQFIDNLDQPVGETLALLTRQRDRFDPANPLSTNPAKALADALKGRIIAIYASSGIMDAAAYRWRSQIAENAKNLAFHHVLPEMNHNELVGWKCPEEALRNLGVVMLRDREDHPQVQRRFELTGELIAEKAGVLREVWSEGDSLLARILSIIYLGDYVSVYLAYLNDTDPTPVRVIDYLKQKLGGSR